jgi:hypothetical protein
MTLVICMFRLALNLRDFPDGFVNAANMKNTHM